jgi:hypothetical protein
MASGILSGFASAAWVWMTCEPLTVPTPLTAGKTVTVLVVLTGAAAPVCA